MKKRKLEVVPLVKYNQNAKSWGAKAMLKDVLADIEAGEIPAGAKMMVIWLDEAPNLFTPYYYQCGMRSSDMLTLLETTKLKIYTQSMMPK